MKILLGCESSQVVCKAFRDKGHEAYSCDIVDCYGNYPEWHLKMNVLDAILQDNRWDMAIFFPPCTHLAVSGARWFNKKLNQQREAMRFFMQLINAPIPKIAVENPIGIMSTYYRKPDQIIQPWQFGHGETKSTCLWLKNLPLLQPTNIVEGREGRIWKMAPSPERAKNRSKTYQGIGEAMANQWS